MQKILFITQTILMGFLLGMLFSTATDAPVLTTIGTTGLLFLVKPVPGALGLNLPNLSWAPGTLNVPGVKSIVYYIPKAHISTWPTLPADATSADQEVTLSGDFTLAAGKYWKTFYSTQGKGKVEDESQGEMDCMSFANKGSFVYPGSQAAALAFCKQANNDDYVYLLEDVSTGKMRVIGNENFRTVTKTAVTTGDSPTGGKGVTVTVETTNDSPAYVYDGAVLLES